MISELPICVALPMYRSRYNGWIALESLVRQRNVPCNWELVVAEEVIDCFGEKAVRSYASKLKAVGCASIKYISLDKRIPLSMKWVLIARNSTSKYFLLQAVDCFSQPSRLKETYQIFEKNSPDWIRSPKGYFYDMSTDKVYLFDQGRFASHPGGLNMATKTDYMRRLPKVTKFRSIDRWIYSSISLLIGNVNISENSSENWKYGVDVNGMNRISRRSLRMENEEKGFSKTAVKINEILDQGIINRLKESYLLETRLMKASETLLR